MDSTRERRGIAALRAYVLGDTSEPVVLSAFRDVTFDERTEIVTRHRRELEGLDDARLLIAESLLLPLDARSR